MERKRNRPEKYNRDLVHKTVKAVEKVSAVRPAARAHLAACPVSGVRCTSATWFTRRSRPSRRCPRCVSCWWHAFGCTGLDAAVSRVRLAAGCTGLVAAVSRVCLGAGCMFCVWHKKYKRDLLHKPVKAVQKMSAVCVHQCLQLVWCKMCLARVVSSPSRNDL